MTPQPPSIPWRLLLVAVLFACASCGGELAEAPRGARPPSGRSELGVFMKTMVNPPFSKLSFLLFHSDADDDVAPDALPATAAELSRAATTLATWASAPSESEQGKSVFYDYAQSLKTDAAELESVLRTNRRDAAPKAFESLRKKCDSCHHFFRYDESAALDDRADVRIQVAEAGQ